MEVWSEGFFGVNAGGRVVARPAPETGLEIEIAAVVAAAREEGLSAPLLIRFQDILKARVDRLNQAFADAVSASGYASRYQSIYPIKVNQLREVVEEILDAGSPWQLGLECGSKPELVAALPLVGTDRLLICNGVKDAAMLSLMLSAQTLGQAVLPVIEKYSEYEELQALADARGMQARLGVRIKLSTRGAGRWFESGGSRSKFGLTAPELLRLVSDLEQRDARPSLELLHFHLGSQIADINALRSAVREMAQIYADLRQRGLPIRYLDVGGGLGVNYGGDYGSADSAIAYGLAEYANAVVYTVQEICAARDVPAPVLLSESGRALTAHHSVLVVPVLGVHRPDAPVSALDETAGHDPSLDEPVVRRLQQAVADAEAARELDQFREAYHDAAEAREDALSLLRLGYLSLGALAAVDVLYWNTCRIALEGIRRSALNPPPPEQLELEARLTDVYLCDFSVFQSVLDHWAIGQLFPIMPLDGLVERPERRAQVVDLTCDSDGKIGRYVVSGGTADWLPLHAYAPGPAYYLGFFLVGAYQEILGDAHNLLGRVAEVHVYASADEPGNFWIEETLPGIRVGDMLADVQYFTNDLDRRMSDLVKARIEVGAVKPHEGMRILNQYTALFAASTYCDLPATRQS